MSGQESHYKWGSEEKKEQILKLQNSKLWDNKMLEMDLESKSKQTYGPFNYGAFPVVPYVEGLGVSTRKIVLEKTHLVVISFFAGITDINKEFISGKNDETFFTIICTYNKEFSPIKNLNIISRNFPNYFGQGVIKQNNEKDDIEFAAFLTADRKQFAIVNTRLFDLDMGRIVLIAPQKNGTTNSIQIDKPIASSQEILKIVDELLKENEYHDFFTRRTNQNVD